MLPLLASPIPLRNLACIIRTAAGVRGNLLQPATFLFASMEIGVAPLIQPNAAIGISIGTLSEQMMLEIHSKSARAAPHNPSMAANSSGTPR